MKLEAQRPVPDNPNEVCLLFLGDDKDEIEIMINVDKESLLKILTEIK